MKTHFGQGLSEYSLLAGILITLAVGSLMTLSGTFTNLFQQSSGRLKAIPLAAAVPLSNATETVAGGSNQSGTSASPPNFTSSLAPGAYQSIGEIIPYTEVEQLIETSGVSGVNNRLMEGLIVTAEAMKAAGELDEASANAIINLANQGFRIASIQEILDSRIKSSDSLQKINDTLIEFDGTSYSFAQLNNLLQASSYAFDSNENFSTMTQVTSLASGAELKEFTNLYQTVVDSGALSNSHLKVLLEQASLMVFKSSDLQSESYSDHFDYALKNNAASRQQELLDQVVRNVAADYKQITSENSTTICAAGQGTASDETCN